jgi:hypothetical protein
MLLAAASGDLGAVARRDAFLQRALALRENVHGPHDPHVAESLLALAAAAHGAARLEDAEALSWRACEILERDGAAPAADVSGRCQEKILLYFAVLLPDLANLHSKYRDFPEGSRLSVSHVCRRLRAAGGDPARRREARGGAALLPARAGAAGR